MAPKILKLDVSCVDSVLLREAASVVKSGGVVVYPTETLYGLGCDAFNMEAVEKIFELKSREGRTPLSVAVANFADVQELVEEVPPSALVLMRKYWPGPLTIVLRKSSELPGLVTGGLPTVGLRMPDHPVALALIKEAGAPLVSTSANLSGQPGPTTVDEIPEEIKEKVDLVLDSGPTEHGKGSTVVDLSQEEPKIFREGAIDKETILRELV